MPLKICPSYSGKESIVKENVPGKEFQESHESFSATFKWKVAGIESLEDLKIKIFREFDLRNALKEEKSF